MGNELWTSKLTGYRRKGTKFTSLKQIFIDNVTAKIIYEPLLSCPIDLNAADAKHALEVRDFDVAGVKEQEDGEVIGYVLAKEIGEGPLYQYLHNITQENLISDSTPIAEIFDVLSDKGYVFVLYGNKVTGIITLADTNKPPVRIYVFGILSLLEMHLNLWINHYYPDGSWVDNIKEKRVDEARELYNIRKGNNQDLSLLECIQLCDKRDMLKNTDGFRECFNFTKNKFERFIKKAEKIRNELAHSQNSIISNLSWKEFVETIIDAEQFLIDSDNEVERIAKDGADFQDMLIL